METELIRAAEIFGASLLGATIAGMAYFGRKGQS